MHELSLARAIVAAVEKHAEGRPVGVVNVRVGRLRQVVPDSLELAFGFAARETVCDGARLAVEAVPALLRCGGCGHEWELDEPRFRCPSCDSADVAIMGGDELLVESIEPREEQACTAPL